MMFGVLYQCCVTQTLTREWSAVIFLLFFFFFIALTRFFCLFLFWWKLTQEKQVRRCMYQEFHKWFSHKFGTATARKQHIHHAIQWEKHNHPENDEQFFCSRFSSKARHTCKFFSKIIRWRKKNSIRQSVIKCATVPWYHRLANNCWMWGCETNWNAQKQND